MSNTRFKRWTRRTIQEIWQRYIILVQEDERNRNWYYQLDSRVDELWGIVNQLKEDISDIQTTSVLFGNLPGPRPTNSLLAQVQGNKEEEADASSDDEPGVEPTTELVAEREVESVAPMPNEVWRYRTGGQTIIVDSVNQFGVLYSNLNYGTRSETEGGILTLGEFLARCER